MKRKALLTENKFFSDIRTFLLTSIGTIAVIQFDLFGSLGLAIYGLLIAYSLLVSITILRKGKPLQNCAFYCTFAFLFWYLFTSIINRKYVGLSIIAQMTAFAFISFFPREIKKIDRDLVSLAKLMTVMGTLMGAGTILIPWIVNMFPGSISKLPSFLSEYIFKSAGYIRVTGPANNPNTTAGISLVSIMGSFYLLTKLKNNYKWLALSLVCIVLSMPTIFILTASRTSMLACIVFVITYSFLQLINHVKDDRQLKRCILFFATIIITLILFFILVIIINLEFRNFLLDRVIRIDSLKDGSGRLKIYEVSWEMFLESPITGADYIQFEEYTKQVSSHNVILEVLTFTGIPGFVLFLTFVVLSFIASIRNFLFCRKAKSEFASMTCIILSFFITHFVYGLTEAQCIDSMRMITIFFYLAIGASNVIAEAISNNGIGTGNLYGESNMRKNIISTNSPSKNLIIPEK